MASSCNFVDDGGAGRGLLRISVIVCTLNPDRTVLGAVLDALRNQTLPRRAFEVLVVDNRSDPPLTAADAPGADRLLQEPRGGLAYARAHGIRASRAPLLVFVDDDNLLDAEYLSRADRIAREQPALGAFGGIAEAALAAPAPDWTRPLWPGLGIRNSGPGVSTRASDEWGPWLPIGAGCVVRREPALAYADLITGDQLGDLLGRNGRRFRAGDDTLLAWTAVWSGYACSYQPSLRLQHRIRPARFHWWNLARTEFGHGAAFPVLEALRGRPLDTGAWPRRAANLLWAVARRVCEDGLRAGLIRWCWDLGVFWEAPRWAGQRRPVPAPARPER